MRTQLRTQLHTQATWMHVIENAKPHMLQEWGSPAVLADKRNPEDADKGTKSNFLIQLGMMPVEAGTPPSPSPSEQE